MKCIEALSVGCRRVLVVACGGAADLILAKAVAGRAVHAGATLVDILQPIGGALDGEKIRRYGSWDGLALTGLGGADPSLVLRHEGVVPNPMLPMKVRGKGIRISAGLSWDHGLRLVCRGSREGLAALFAWCEANGRRYDVVLLVDGGGDVLTHPPEEFDRQVLDAVETGVRPGTRLQLLVLAPGADGGSEPEEFANVVLQSWKLVGTDALDLAFADGLERDLRALNLWMTEVDQWSAADPLWDYGLKVPQILALALRELFPFDEVGSQWVHFPRRKGLKRMGRSLLQSVLWFEPEGR